MNKYLEIVNIDTDEIVRRIDMSYESERKIERCIGGFEINLNHNQYYVHLNETEETLTLIG
jgi:hypothetical protein